ncbi:MAG: alcohol dehydrogenase [Anaerolineaceae bacterium]|nr:alcohol dehydrogenase [Anaerolineaceae bacterium]
MRALRYDGDLRLEHEVTQPVPDADEALLKIRLAGICNTDLELIDGMYDFSGILGHEFVADVAEGPAHLVGKRVVGEINVGCKVCDFCRQGIVSQCRNRAAIGIHGHAGAFADFLTLDVANLHVVPSGIDDDVAVFTEPLAAVLQIPEAVWIAPRHRVLVVGVGKLGMLAAQVLKLTGADVAGVVRHQKQADLLDRWHIPAYSIDELAAEQADIVVDCTGQASGFADALRLVRSRGTIVLKSTYRGTPQADLTQVAVREIRVVGSRCGPFDAALRLFDKQLVDVRSMIEARYPLERAQDAVAHARQHGVLKVLLEI